MGYFALRAKLSPAGIAALRTRTAVQMRADLARAAGQLGGSLEELYFFAGDLGIFAVLDLPSAGSSGPFLQLLASGGFEAGASFARIETADEVDAGLRDCPAATA